MKNLLSLIIIIIIISPLFSQTINDVPISQLNVRYMQIVGTQPGFKNQVIIHLDFGQETTIWNAHKKSIIKDINGDLMTFNSMIDALNFLSNYGYRFVNASAITSGNTSVYYYMLEKEVEVKLNSRQKIQPLPPVYISPNDNKLRIGRKVYFKKNNQLIEAKIILIDEIGVKIEYFDKEKNKKRTKFLDEDLVFVKEK